MHGVIGSISFLQAEVKRAKKEEEREKEKEKEKEKEAKKQQDGTENDNKVGPWWPDLSWKFLVIAYRLAAYMNEQVACTSACVMTNLQHYEHTSWWKALHKADVQSLKYATNHVLRLTWEKLFCTFWSYNFL